MKFKNFAILSFQITINNYHHDIQSYIFQNYQLFSLFHSLCTFFHIHFSDYGYVMISLLIDAACTAWKKSKNRVFSGPYIPAFGLGISSYSVWMRENTDQKKFRIWPLLKQWWRCLFWSEFHLFDVN